MSDEKMKPAKEMTAFEGISAALEDVRAFKAGDKSKARAVLATKADRYVPRETGIYKWTPNEPRPVRVWARVDDLETMKWYLENGTFHPGPLAPPQVQEGE